MDDRASNTAVATPTLPVVEDWQSRGSAQGPSLQTRSGSVALMLRDSLEPIVRWISGQTLRPATVARELEIDRTLAARIVRGVKSPVPALVFKEVPSPAGLRIFMDACQRTGVPQQLVDDLGDSVRGFERLIDEFSGGRSELEAALSAWDPGVRQRAEHAAKQAIHKAMCTLLGYQTEVMVGSLIVAPSRDDEEALDTVNVLGKFGIRRLRTSSPITVFGRRQDLPPPPGKRAEAGSHGNGVETLGGEVNAQDAHAYLLREFCTNPLPPLNLFSNAGLKLYTLPEGQPSINRPVDLVGVLRHRADSQRYATPEMKNRWASQVVRIPSRYFVSDVFMHKSAYPDSTPVVTTTLHGLATNVRPDVPSFQLDKIDLSIPIQSLGRGLTDADLRELPRYRSMMATIFDRLGWNPDDFRGYRVRVQYPVPMVAISYWFDLPERPKSPSA